MRGNETIARAITVTVTVIAAAAAAGPALPAHATPAPSSRATIQLGLDLYGFPDIPPDPHCGTCLT